MSERKKEAQKEKMSVQTARRLLVGGAVVLVLAIAAVAVFLSTGAQRMPADTLRRYYEGLYLTANVEQMKLCIAPSAQDQFDQAYTMGGTGNMTRSYVSEMMGRVGGNAKLSVKITAKQETTSQGLNQLRSDYPAVQDYANVDFLLYFRGDDGERTLQGATTMIKLGGKWYLPDYQIAVGAATGK